MSAKDYYNSAPQHGDYSNYGPPQQQQYQQHPQQYDQQQYQPQYQQYPQQGYSQPNHEQEAPGCGPGTNSWEWCCGIIQLFSCLEMCGVLVSNCI